MSGTEEAEALHLGLGLAHAHASLQALLDERLGRWHGLALSDFRLLGVLVDAPPGGLPTAQLAAALHVGPSALVRQLMPLHKTGLLARDSGTVQLRPVGRRLHAEAAQTVGAVCRQVCAAAGLDRTAWEALRAQLQALAQGAARVNAGARSR